MTTCRDIIKRAYHMAGIVALGVDPKAKEAEYGLETLQSMFDSWVSTGLFGPLNDIIVSAAYTAQEQDRIRHNGQTITYPTSYNDRPPYDLSLVEAFNTAASARTVKLWDRDAWVDLLSLTLDTEAPLAKRGALGLSACLAEMIAGTSGIEVSSSVVRQAGTFRFGLSYKLGATAAPRTAEYF